MTKIIGGSGFIGTRLSKRPNKNSSEFNVAYKDMSKSFENICSRKHEFVEKNSDELLYTK